MRPHDCCPNPLRLARVTGADRPAGLADRRTVLRQLLPGGGRGRQMLHHPLHHHHRHTIGTICHHQRCLFAWLSSANRRCSVAAAAAAAAVTV